MYTEEEVRALLTPEWLPRIQSAVTLPDSEPEPDVAVVAGPRRRYETHHPRPNEIAFLIEVADSTLADDRGFKGRLYARARIPIYWIVNLPGRQVEVYTRPRAGKTPHYRGCEVFGEGTNVPVVIGTTMLGSIPVKNLLPSA
jgi:Uma2 family endonuclease